MLLLALTNILYAQTSCKSPLPNQKLNQNLNSNKIKTAKHLIETNKCFLVLQIKGLLDLFDYESARIDILKHGYQHTINKREYYRFGSGTLGFESSKKRLSDYINAESQ